ncbi:Proteasome lid subunit RPN8/RPN11, contains Jab1/MPN metalloenzyme (JAMM) motif [Paenibacillus sp. 1_12]|uniref:Mov34/MPN/PAD-1 family protein n=1 Tax=Paenibacillus sp. 1_12 TaxID=1566278 RepID=UPI0008E952B7|nr:M67 family metallopeptidase [Paenibacillus sp. 1_12]SFL27322.1 Proteasome lid subunit RPN8/RPN11, contains Jab1/MPN metalloenzyme (JAMM) motif [Paenibacillus sp. 1_12]
MSTSITSIQLKNSVRTNIINYCIANKPLEACGFLLGCIDLSQIRITSFVPVANASVNPETQFSMHPKDMIPIVSNNTLTIVGILHSHPGAAAIPSEEDLSTYWHDIPSHWIVSLQQPIIEIAAYQYTHMSQSLSNFTSAKFSIMRAQYHPVPITVIDDEL